MKKIFTNFIKRGTKNSNTTNGKHASNLLLDIKEIVDHSTIQKYLLTFKREGELLIGSIAKNGVYKDIMEGTTPIIFKIKSNAKKTTAICKALIDRAKFPYKQERINCEEHLKSYTDDEHKNNFLEQNKEEILSEVANSQKPLSKVNSYNNEATIARNKKEEAASLMQNICNKLYDGYRPIHKAIHGWLYFVILIICLPTELVLHMNALQDLPDQDLSFGLLLPIALTLTFLMTLSAHFSGSWIAKGLSRVLIYGAIITGLITVFITLYIRSGAGSAFILSFVNLAIYILLIALSYVHTKPQNYFEAEKAFKYWLGVEDNFWAKIDDIKKTAKADDSNITDKWNTRSSKYLNSLKKEILELKRAEAIIDNYLETNVQDPIKALEDDFTTHAKIELYKARKKNGLNELIDDQQESNNHKNNDHVNNTKFNGFKSDIHTVILALIMMFAVTGCGYISEPPIFNDIVVISDSSIEHKDSLALPSVGQQVSYVLSKVNFTPHNDTMNVIRDRIRVRLTKIVDTSFPPIQTIELDGVASVWSMVKSKRRIEQTNFVQDFYESLVKYSPPKGLKTSHVVDCFCEILPPLAKSNASNKLVFIVSDLLENSNFEHFYTLGNNITNQFNTISDNIDNHCHALKNIDLNGIEFTAVYLPNIETDNHIRQSKVFWKKYIEGKGGTFSFVPNLPEVKSSISMALE